MELHAHVDGEVAGRLTVLLSKTGRRALVDHIHSFQPGQGHASALMDEFQTRYPDTSIDHGERTDDGKAWWSKYSAGKTVRNGRTL